MTRIHRASARRTLATALIIAGSLQLACEHERSANKPQVSAATATSGQSTDTTTPSPNSPVDPANAAATGSIEPPPESLETVREKHRNASRLLREAIASIKREDLAAARKALDTCLALRPRYPEAWAAHAALLRAEGKHEESLAYTTERIAEEEANGRLLETERSLLLREKTLTLHAMGKTDQALAIVDALIVDDSPRLRDRYLRAQLLAARGDADATIAALEDTVEHGFLGGQQLRADPAFVSLAGDERFVAILERLDAVHTENQRRLRQHLTEGGESPEAAKEPMLTELRTAAHSDSCLVFLERNLGSESGEPRNLTTVTLDGDRLLELENYRGRPTIVLFWGMWSETGQKQVERLAAATTAHREKGLNVVLLHHASPDPASADPWAEAASWLESRDIDLPCGKIGEEWKDFGAVALPATYFLDARGRVALQLFGPIETPLLEKIADRLLASTAPKSD